MSKIFWKALQVSPTFLGVILVFANSVIVAEASGGDKRPQSLLESRVVGFRPGKKYRSLLRTSSDQRKIKLD